MNAIWKAAPAALAPLTTPLSTDELPEREAAPSDKPKEIVPLAGAKKEAAEEITKLSETEPGPKHPKERVRGRLMAAVYYARHLLGDACDRALVLLIALGLLALVKFCALKCGIHMP